ncbi:Fe-S protein assembly co-chaperone HscB [Anaplasma bovis]|uniref:Fe-S protein assembly co-chaperone HscB n=1 Tax=Anaplasma bovis TaxID=186733 RepID=UPI002FF3F770
MSDDYFTLLGLGDASFSIDLALMEKNYIDIQRCSHPDRFFFIKDKESAVKHIARVNKAYLVLKSPVSRAEYMLETSGVRISEEDRSKIVEEVFELNLTSEEVRNAVEECFKKIGLLFAEGDMYQAAMQVEKLKYLKGIERSKRGCS